MAKMRAYSTLNLRLSEAFRYIVPALIAASILEFSLIRTFSRMGVVLPKQKLVFDIYDLLILTGSFMFNFASLLVLLAVALAGVLVFTRTRRSSFLLSASALALIQLSIYLVFYPPTAAISVAFDATALLAVLSAALFFDSNAQNRAQRAFVWLLAASYASTYYFKALPGITQLFDIRVEQAYTIQAFNLGEAFAVLNGVVAFFAFSYRRSGFAMLSTPTLAATVVSVLFAASYLRSPWLTSTISTWTLGFTLFLPFPFYTVALWLYCYTLLDTFRTNRRVAYSLILILLAGRTLQLTYLNLLAILGLLLLSHAAGDFTNKETGVRAV